MVPINKRHRNSLLKTALSAPRIKICGLRDATQALQVISLGADAVGLMLYAPSPRSLSLAQAAKIRAVLPPFIIVVAVVANPSTQEVMEIIKRVRPHLLQFHGDEKEDFCRSFDFPYIKVVHAKSAEHIKQQAMRYISAKALMLDTHSKEAYGGTGKAFDYSIVPPNLPLPLILAGGLTADNVHSAIERLNPYAVDVSSGVESVPGEKDIDKVRAFIHAVKG